MSPGEVWWRVGNKLRDSVDKRLLQRRQRVMELGCLRNGTPLDEVTRADVIGGHLCRPGSPDGGERGGSWLEALVHQAEGIRSNRLNLFDLSGKELGERIDWNYEYKARKAAPRTFSASIDYRDYDVAGDCKFVWEPNRHHQLVVLGRAYRATGDARFARAVANQLEDWLCHCPYGVGMNWRSPLELAIRLINWVWALELIRPAGVISPASDERLLTAVYRHLWEVSRKYSRFSSANNHLIGEAAGVLIGSGYFRGVGQAERWRRESWEILSREVLKQTFPDGGNREQAVGYHMFVLQFCLFAGLAARNAGFDFEEDYWHRLEKMFEFIGALAEGGDALPMFGDCDDGYVLDLGGRDHIVHSYLSAGAVLFGRSDFKAASGGFGEPAYWLFGAAGRERFDRIATEEATDRIGPRAFPDSGYYLLQRGRRGGSDRVSVVFDCGELGFESIAAHGHADALSLTLRVSGADVLVDPGTYDYFTYSDWRNYFRSTRAHNTVVIDEADQSQMQGSFMWGRKAVSTCREWAPSDNGGRIVAEHDGYTRLANPVTHRRTVALEDKEDVLVIKDEIITSGSHKVDVYWHLAEQCGVQPQGDNRFEVDYGHGKVILVFDQRLSVTAIKGSEEPILGWVSRGYHRKTPSTTFVGSFRCDGDTSFLTRILLVA